MMTPRHDVHEPGEATAPAAFADALRAVGLRVTAPRLATLAVVAETPHCDADTVAGAVRARLGSVSKQAVYDVLHALTAADLVRRISLDDRRARYELHAHDNHHHAVCRGCGSIVDVPCVEGAAPCLDAPRTTGFAIEQADVIYRGLCASCREAEAAIASATAGPATATDGSATAPSRPTTAPSRPATTSAPERIALTVAP